MCDIKMQSLKNDPSHVYIKYHLYVILHKTQKTIGQAELY